MRCCGFFVVFIPAAIMLLSSIKFDDKRWNVLRWELEVDCSKQPLWNAYV
jgi:hypothetical protein